MAEKGVTLDESYIAERDRMRRELDQAATELDDLPFGVKGIAKAAYAVWRAIGIPLFATFTKTSGDMKEGLETLREDKTYKINVKKNDDWWKGILRIFGYKEETIKALENMIPDDMPGPNLIYTAYVVFFIFNQVGTLARVISGDTYKELVKRFRPSTPSAADILKASFIAPELDGQVKEFLRENGFTEEAIKLLYISQYQLQSIDQIRAIFYREGKTWDWANNRLSELGFTPERIEEIKSLFPVIPGIQDLIMMQAHEQFEPDLIAKFGLHAEAPTEIYEWTRKLGLSDEWTTKYWGGHWIHPAYAQVMEMLHRRFITPEDVWEWFKLVEIPPYWRELLMKISYSPYTRVDARRMHDIGVLSDEELIGVYMDLGYDREHAEKLVEWTVKYNLDNDKEITRSDILKGYEDGDLTEAETVMLLKQIGYREDHAYYLIWQIENEKIRAARLDYIEYVKAQFLSHLIPETEARANLLGAGLAQTRVNELIVRWRTIQINNTKLPSKTDLDKWLKADIITKERYYQEMGFLGYRKGYVDLYYEQATKGIE